jgi:transcriptional regulator GlxA family with amidase domain
VRHKPAAAGSPVCVWALSRWWTAACSTARDAVTHWGVVDELARRRPAVKVNPAALYLDHGDVLTSAGTASAIDACLYIVRTHLGSSAALARRLDEARGLLETTTWPVARIAEACGFSGAVTFRQNFVATYSTTPTSYRQRFSPPRA